MAVSELVYQVLNAQESLAVSFDIPTLNDAAHRIAFYTAMLEANAVDPMDDPEDNAEIVRYMTDCRRQFLHVYMDIINENT